ncbi:hypothetical protein WK90_34535 [Burkholderia cepacia]|nr:hypothetical protein WK83_34365 [Burkholderia cepacia]KVV67718.1 hypothetical protein WK85_26045 [Burkholderia cepacia]KVV70990.1 hypothetical protein WK84_15265 [Burkholderia cepacia]KVV77394.1 hypothetical protein WK87_36300 [Burkholderia cepacia]KVV85510.1 hypothetical protein WK86_13310 [Burkholderia cepacia]
MMVTVETTRYMDQAEVIPSSSTQDMVILKFLSMNLLLQSMCCVWALALMQNPSTYRLMRMAD